MPDVAEEEDADQAVSLFRSLFRRGRLVADGAAVGAAVEGVSKAWAEDGNPPAMRFTTSEWKSSADIFPMEYADILERRRVLFGESPTDGITVVPSDLRLQVEQQTMGKLLQLRQAIMG